MRVTRAVVFLSALSVLGAGGGPDESVGEIKGDWTIIAMKMGNRSAPDDLIKGLTSNFDGESYTNKASDKVVEQGTYRVDPSKTPRTIDFAIKVGPDAGKRQLGVYAVDGETLTLCVSEAGSDERPASLTPKADSPAMTFVMKRAKR